MKKELKKEAKASDDGNAGDTGVEGSGKLDEAESSEMGTGVGGSGMVDEAESSEMGA